jgi:hypothetical protein
MGIERLLLGVWETKIDTGAEPCKDGSSKQSRLERIIQFLGAYFIVFRHGFGSKKTG